MNAFNTLTKLFSDFPGIGPRQAKRFVYFLLSRDKEYILELKKNIELLEKEIKTCVSCFRYFESKNSDTVKCSICEDTNRDRNILLLVARDVDLENIEKTHTYEGLYFVLGSTIPILEKDPGKKIRLSALKRRLEEEKDLKEIIIAMNANPEGENTEDYLLAELKSLGNWKISRLGRGLSTGVELEYSDQHTLKNALENRH